MSKNLAYMQERLNADKENLQAQTDALQGLKDGKGGVGAIDTDNALKSKSLLKRKLLRPMRVSMHLKVLSQTTQRRLWL